MEKKKKKKKNHYYSYNCLHARPTCLLECPAYNTSETMRCSWHTEAFRCLHSREAIIDRTNFVLLRGRLVCKVHSKSDRRVGALDFISAIKPLTNAEKSVRLLADCASTDFVLDEQRDDTSPHKVRPSSFKMAFLAEIFLNVETANDR